ncbi:hypothetical protein J4G33_04680 [Actinotalea sp. BY-33]|uniref:Uncharacterized protein n=1 Tax=Actinotalea soli TaxID=2819234 RepID=A0A939LNX9_9CELL|nr:hypothetical protein [Actinotalea soli]MBO1751094.1 hypothetical protein [Actinotalea soli]
MAWLLLAWFALFVVTAAKDVRDKVLSGFVRPSRASIVVLLSGAALFVIPFLNPGCFV